MWQLSMPWDDWEIVALIEGNLLQIAITHIFRLRTTAFGVNGIEISMQSLDCYGFDSVLQEPFDPVPRSWV
jgi:hypothetical protein